MNYNVISSGSKGNCIIYKDIVMVDIGIKLKDKGLIAPFLDSIKVIFLTHEHTDHIQVPLLKWIVKNYPNIMIAYPSYLDEFLDDVLVEYNRKTKEYDIIEMSKYKALNIGTHYNFGLFQVDLVNLYHDVPNVGYFFKFKEDNYKIFHGTDTYTFEGITIPSDTNLVAIEHHHEEEHYEQLIESKKIERLDNPDNKVFIHEQGARNSHHSFEQCEHFLERNKIKNATVLRLHISSDEYYKDIPIEYNYQYEEKEQKL